MLRIWSLILLLATPAVAGIDGPARVIDGDTVEIGGVRVRLFGIDAPEAGQHCRTEQGIDWACGAWVTAEVRDRYQGQRFDCTPRDTDRYGRTVATCAVAGRDVGAALVADGLAIAYRRYGDDYAADEDEARARDLGLWSGAMQRPEWVRRLAVTPAAQPPAGCAIKGNVSDRGRVYHLPGSRWYDATRIDPGRGERWFCSETEARVAGWRVSGG